MARATEVQITAPIFIVTHSVTFTINGVILYAIRRYNSTCQDWETESHGKAWAVVRTAVESVTMRMVARGQGKTQLNPVSKHLMML